MVYDFTDKSNDWGVCHAFNADTGDELFISGELVTRIDIETGDFDAYAMDGSGRVVLDGASTLR